MRRLALMLFVFASLPLAVVFAGCGKEDLEPVSVAEAAQGTRDAETARVTYRMTIAGVGMPRETTIDGGGVTATRDLRMDITFDFGPFLEAFGAGGDGATRVVLDEARLYVDPPDLEGLELPDGATWVTADIGAIMRSLGVEPEGLGELMRLTPAQQLEALEAAGDLAVVGEEEVDGDRTTHLRGSIKVSDYIEILPPEQREQVREAIRRLEALSGESATSLDDPVPTELWVDEEKRIRRMRQTTAIPAQEGVPAGKMELELELSDFGAELDLPEIAEDDVFDATGLLTQAIGQAGATP